MQTWPGRLAPALLLAAMVAMASATDKKEDLGIGIKVRMQRQWPGAFRDIAALRSVPRGAVCSALPTIAGVSSR
jgi:hypothetical protein